MDTTHPLSSSCINTFHDTYLRHVPDANEGAEGDATLYGKALGRGFRCFELDLCDGPKSNSDPEVQFRKAKNKGGGRVCLLRRY
mmetsp:Transcript_51039/g.153420  ORF Transcript_51039/g.153420 Transcript_51039/m.153420 type:complete len:84 (-) Transcript_51039:411-662(-)